MRPSFETQVVSVGGLFDGEQCYRIPTFQRSYSWTEAQAAQLLDDILVSFERVRGTKRRDCSNAYYFVGPVILARDGLTGSFDVVDGQQRLTTTSAILAMLRDLLPTGNFKADLQKRLTRAPDSIARVDETPRILTQETNREEYHRIVHTVGGTLGLTQRKSIGPIAKTVARMKNDFGDPDAEYVEGVARYILENTFAIRMYAKTVDDAYLLFRSVNTPGEPLSGLDLVKGELLGIETDDSRAASRLADAWDKIELELGREKLEGYVQTVLTLATGEAIGGDLKHSLRKIMSDPIRMVAFRKDLATFIRAYSHLQNATLEFGPDSDAVNRVVACFRGIPFDDWQPSALLWLTKPGTSYETLKFFRALNALCLAFVILGTPSGKRRKRFDKINNRIHDGNILSSANSEIYLSDAERTEIRSKLKEPVAPNSKYIKTLLLRINAEMQHRSVPLQFPDEITIEHVLPQTPAQRSQWKKLFPNPRRRKEFCYSLGNLTILTHDANSAIRNSEFNIKKREIFGIHGNQAFALNQRISATPEWDEIIIAQRCDELIDLADRVLRA